ncbi:ABC transporter permease [Clostridium sp. CM028]|uniref:ABC transporter permease n=1 Tax=Clostridium sp. CM028 TaxID=2851575 RepID=UPI001C6E2FAE|nr:ABC transporter permease [Clostridium sp. CM028]MBW9147643.1 ABC transporter permease [Clostridium sp. CM028]WLC61973.1 ABC transporter permease [Clostridium sp. CM028]
MQVIHMAFLHLKRMLKQKTPIFSMILIPVLVVGAIVYFTRDSKDSFNETVDITIVNKDKGSLGNKLIEELKTDKNFKIKESDLAEAQIRIKQNKTGVTLVIPEIFTENLESGNLKKLDIMKLSDSNMDIIISKKVNNFVTQRLLSNKVISVIKQNDIVINTSYGEISRKIDASLSNNPVKAELEEVKKDGTRTLSGSLSTSLIINFLMFSMIYIVIEMVELRNNKTLRRSLSTPNKNGSIIGSVLLSMLFLCWIQIGLMVTVTKYIFHIYWGKSMFAVFLIFTIFIVVVLSIGLLISRYSKNQSQAVGIVNLVVTPTCIISGTTMPLEFLPAVFKKIAYFTPQNWALSALNDVALRNSGVIDILPKLGILILFALVFFTAGSKSLKEMVEV